MGTAIFRQQLRIPAETERPEAIEKVKEYAEEGYRYAVAVDLSKYFDTLNHELLMNLLHRKIQDMRVLRIIKKYLKSGVNY